MTELHTWPNGRLLQMWAGRLARAGFTTELGDVRRATRSEAPDVRGIAFAWLGVHDDREAMPEIRTGLVDSYPPARVEAARAAALLGEAAGAAGDAAGSELARDGRAQLAALLSVDWPETALNAAAYLADLGDPSGAPVMAAAAAGPVEALRLQAVLLVRAFQRFGAQPIDAVAVLRRALLEDPSALVRREAVYQVAALGRQVAAPILTLATSDADPAVAKAARLRVDGEP